MKCTGFTIAYGFRMRAEATLTPGAYCAQITGALGEADAVHHALSTHESVGVNCYLNCMQIKLAKQYDIKPKYERVKEIIESESNGCAVGTMFEEITDLSENIIKDTRHVFSQAGAVAATTSFPASEVMAKQLLEVRPVNLPLIKRATLNVEKTVAEVDKAINEAEKDWNDGRVIAGEQLRAAAETWDAIHQKLQKVKPELNWLRAQRKSIEDEILALQHQIDFVTDFWQS